MKLLNPYVALAFCTALAACGGGGGDPAPQTPPSNPPPTEPETTTPDETARTFPVSGRLPLPINGCDPSDCNGHTRGQAIGSLALHYQDQVRKQQVGLQSGAGDAFPNPITVTAAHTSSAETPWYDNGEIPVVMVGSQQDIVDWGWLNGVHQTREGLERLPVVRSEDAVDIRYGRLEDGAGARTLSRFWASWIDDERTNYPGDPNDYGEALRYRTPPVIQLIGSPTALERQETIAAVQAINAAMPDHFQLRIGATKTGLSFPDDRSAWNQENTISIEFVDLPDRRLAQNDSFAFADNEFRSDGSIEWSYIRMGRDFGHQTPGSTDNFGIRQDFVWTLTHELGHALGIYGHPDGFEFRTLMAHTGGTNVWPTDREAFHFLYTNLEPGDPYPFDFGEWQSDSLHIHGNAAHSGFGAAVRNGYAESWAYGFLPDGYLHENRALSGTASWVGTLLGLTPSEESVRGVATVTVDVDRLTGNAAFTELERWNGAPRHAGSGRTWGDGDLRYGISVHGNAFRERSGDAGTLTGSFTGKSHEGVAGTLERSDLTAAFGGSR